VRRSRQDHDKLQLTGFVLILVILCAAAVPRPTICHQLYVLLSKSFASDLLVEGTVGFRKGTLSSIVSGLTLARSLTRNTPSPEQISKFHLPRWIVRPRDLTQQQPFGGCVDSGVVAGRNEHVSALVEHFGDFALNLFHGGPSVFES
jgi:hypothetical protein